MICDICQRDRPEFRSVDIRCNLSDPCYCPCNIPNAARKDGFIVKKSPLVYCGDCSGSVELWCEGESRNKYPIARKTLILDE